MLPPGHIAAGYLVTEGLLYLLQPGFSSRQINGLLLWGAFCGFCPDLDTFYAFYKAKSFTVSSKEINHRAYYSHRPMVWLAGGLAVFLFAPNLYYQCLGLLLWLGSWSHFLLDSFKLGVMWLWPFNNKFYATRESGIREDFPQLGFWKYWQWFLNYYRTRNTVTFALEMVVILVAALVFFWRLTVPHPALAHITATSGTIRVQLHVEPDHVPIVGSQSMLRFEVNNAGGQISLEQCDCQVIIARGEQVKARSQLQSEKHPFIFNESGAYTVTLEGKPKSGGQFAEFNPSFEVKVRESDAAVTSDSHEEHHPQNHIGHAIIYGGGLVVAGWLLWREMRKKSVSKSSDDANKDQTISNKDN